MGASFCPPCVYYPQPGEDDGVTAFRLSRISKVGMKRVLVKPKFVAVVLSAFVAEGGTVSSWLCLKTTFSHAGESGT